MKSIKPGRGPSFMGGVMGIAGALFGVFWTVMAIAGGAWFMAPFGLIFIGVAVFNAIYNLNDTEFYYFTEDVIGLFGAMPRQAHMLMGTTDQIENNPLMLAAMAFGFFHVDRLDKEDKIEFVTTSEAFAGYRKA